MGSSYPERKRLLIHTIGVIFVSMGVLRFGHFLPVNISMYIYCKCGGYVENAGSIAGFEPAADTSYLDCSIDSGNDSYPLTISDGISQLDMCKVMFLMAVGVLVVDGEHTHTY